VISQVEFIDARSSLTGAELNLNVTRFEVLARQAELDLRDRGRERCRYPARRTRFKEFVMTHSNHRQRRQSGVVRRRVSHAALSGGLRQSGARSRQADAGARRAREHGPAVPPIDTNGIVVTKHEMRLSFKMGGVVRRIYVQEGDVVKKGSGSRKIELTEVGAQVEQARQLADKAERDLKRGEICTRTR
jgi:biotin carboxyl carrier protein